MSVNKIKDYKIINGEKIKKTKEEFNRETCGDKKIWYYQGYYTTLLGERKKYKSKKFTTKDEATKEEAKFLLKMGEQTAKSYTFNEIFDEYIEKKKALVRPQTITRNNYLYSHIRNRIGHIKIDKLTLSQYEQFKNKLNKTNFSTDYKNRIHKLVISLIDYSYTYYDVTSKVPKIAGEFKNPLEMKKEMNFFTIDEFNQFLSVIKDEFWKTLFETLFYCGLRQGELQALKWKDIDFTKKTININKTLTTKIKGEKYSIFPPKTKSSYRILPITDFLYNDPKNIYNLYNKLPGFNEDWFVFGGIRPTPETTIQVHKNNYCKMANVQQIRIHDFRHSTASLLISKNADPSLVAKYLGHSNVSMTLNTYSHMYKSKLNSIKEIINTQI